MTEPQLRLTPPSAADLAKRLRTITAGMTAAQQAGLPRPVLDSDLRDLTDTADLLEQLEEQT